MGAGANINKMRSLGARELANIVYGAAKCVSGNSNSFMFAAMAGAAERRVSDSAA